MATQVFEEQGNTGTHVCGIPERYRAELDVLEVGPRATVALIEGDVRMARAFGIADPAPIIAAVETQRFYAHGKTGVLHRTQTCSGRGDLSDPADLSREMFDRFPKCRICKPEWTRES